MRSNPHAFGGSRGAARPRHAATSAESYQAALSEANAAVEVPPDDEDAASRLSERGTERREICFGIDEEGEPIRPLDAPAIAAGEEQAGVALIHAATCMHGQARRRVDPHVDPSTASPSGE